MIGRIRNWLQTLLWLFRPLSVSVAQREEVRRYREALKCERKPFEASPVRLSIARLGKSTLDSSEYEPHRNQLPRPSTFPELEKSFYEEILAIESVRPSRPEPTTPDEARLRMWETMNERASALAILDQIAVPFRYHAGHVIQINSPGSADGAPPRLEVFEVNDYLTDVAMRMSMQAGRIEQLETRNRLLWTLAVLSAIVAYVIL